MHSAYSNANAARKKGVAHAGRSHPFVHSFIDIYLFSIELSLWQRQCKGIWIYRKREKMLEEKNDGKKKLRYLIGTNRSIDHHFHVYMCNMHTLGTIKEHIHIHGYYAYNLMP